MCTIEFFVYVVLFFFKQKTAYEMRISDWSSDVCSSDLGLLEGVEDKESLGQTAGSLGEAMELYLARLFAAYDRSLPPDGLYERVLAEIEPPLLDRKSVV